jgi:hypothetical protein
MTKDDALKKALEGLEKWHFDKDPRGAADYIAAIREALAEQPAQQQDINWKDQYEQQKRRAEMWVAKYEADIGPLEKAGPVTAQQQEPVAWLHNGKLHEVDPIDWATGTVTPLYPSAQFSKPWVDYIALARKVKVYEDALGEIAWSNNSEWQQDRAKQVLAQMRGVEL